MDFFLFLITVASFPALFIGLIKPKWILFFIKNPNRFQIIGLFSVLFLLISHFLKPSDDQIKQTKETHEIQIENLYIPEFCASDIYINLKQKGFKCEGPNLWKSEFQGKQIVNWICDYSDSQGSAYVNIYGHEPCNIFGISSTSQNFTAKESNLKLHQDFLGYLASIPFKNSNQQQNHNWVKKTLQNRKWEKHIDGPVTFELPKSTAPRTRMLDIYTDRGAEYFK